MSEWRHSRLGEALDVHHGWTFKGEFFAQAGTLIVLTPGNFKETGGFQPKSGTEKYYLGDFPERFLLPKGAVVVAMTEQAQGLLGSTATIPESDRYLHNQRIGLLEVTNPSILDLRFVYHLMNTPQVRQQIQATSTGSKVRHTAPGRIRDVVVELPAISTQRVIAGVLDSIDDLIANNRRRVEVLEEMARAIYHEWFVKFRYPGHDDVRLVNLASGAAPNGWVSSRSGELADRGILEIGDGYRAKNAEMTTGGGLPFVRVKNVRDGYVDLSQADFLPEIYRGRLKAKLSRPGDTVLCMKGTVGRMARVSADAVPMAYSPQVSFWRSLDETVVPVPFLHEWLRGESFARQCAAAKGSTTMADYVNLRDQRNMLFLLPAKKVVRQFADLVGPIHALSDDLRSSATRLHDIRELLLPKLVTGQFDVSMLDLEAIVEGAVA